MDKGGFNPSSKLYIFKSEPISPFNSQIKQICKILVSPAN